MLRTIKHAFNILRRGRFTVSGLPWLRAHGVPLPMSLAAYAFDRYKRRRLVAVPGCELPALKLSGQPGLVSVVLPVHNGARYLRQALDSLLAQTYPAWELIAVDDGSTDDSGAMLDDYAARTAAGARLRVIHQSNQKLPAALNTGFHQARGEFLTWISDDNRLYPNFLAWLVDCLQRHPDWDMVYANEDVIGEDGQPLLNSPWFRGNQRPLGSHHIHLPGDTSELNTCDNNTIGAAFLYRRRVLDLLGDYDPARFGVEDYDYWLRVNALLTLRHADDAHGRYLAEPLLAYRFHGDSLSSRAADLGLRRRRTALLGWDDFRRDFYLTPLIWRVEGDNTPRGESFAVELRQRIERAGHCLLCAEYTEQPRLWFPVVFIRVEDSELSEGFNVFVTEGEAALRLSGIREAGALFAAADIWVRARHLERIQVEVIDPPPARCRLSVVICTYRRGEPLERAVASVAAQTLPPADFELLIVNNDPRDASLPARLANLRARYFDRCPARLRLVTCPHLGLSSARNAGLAEAQGEIVCYLDDDAVAEPDWLERIGQAFDRHPQAGVIGGHILLRKPDPLPRWWLPGAEVHWSGFTPSYPAYTEVDHWSKYPIGANWCARRKVLFEIGGFRTRYGRRGASYKSSEEIVAAELVRTAGYRVGVEPLARVVHHVDPDRFTLRHIRGMLLGGRQGWYQAQMDLYFPWELGLRNALRRIGRAMWPPSLRALVRTPYLLLIEALMLAWYLFDLARRFRKPVVRS